MAIDTDDPGAREERTPHSQRGSAGRSDLVAANAYLENSESLLASTFEMVLVDPRVVMESRALVSAIPGGEEVEPSRDRDRTKAADFGPAVQIHQRRQATPLPIFQS